MIIWAAVHNTMQPSVISTEFWSDRMLAEQDVISLFPVGQRGQLSWKRDEDAWHLIRETDDPEEVEETGWRLIPVQVRSPQGEAQALGRIRKLESRNQKVDMQLETLQARASALESRLRIVQEDHQAALTRVHEYLERTVGRLNALAAAMEGEAP